MTKKRKNMGTGRPKKAKKPAISVPIKPVSAVPRAPNWLSEHAKTEWRRTAAQLVERKVLTTSDLCALETFCSAKGRLVLAEGLLEKDGLTTTGQNGALAKHPAISIASEASSVIKTLGAALGLTPASRRRAATEEAAESGSRWDGLVDG